MPNAETLNPVLADLMAADENTLLEQLGMRSKAVTAGVVDAMGYTATPVYEVALMGPLDDLRTLGRRLLARWNRELYKVMCGSDKGDASDRESLFKALGLGDVAVAAAITAVLVSSFAMAPAIATVVAALVVKRIVVPAGGEICAFWGEQLPKG